MIFAENLVFFRNVLFGERMFQLITSLLQLQDELIEALVNVSGLLLVQTLNLSLDMVDKATVVIINAFSVDHQLVQVVDILLNDVCHILKLS